MWVAGVSWSPYFLQGFTISLTTYRPGKKLLMLRFGV